MKASTIKAPEGYKTVVCRLCRQAWFIPEQYVDQYTSDRGFECNNCRSAFNSFSKYIKENSND